MAVQKNGEYEFDQHRYQKRKGLLLVKPRSLIKSDKVAKAIAMRRGVREVFLTSGEYAIVVAVDAHRKSIGRIKKAIDRVVKRAVIKSVTQHYSYRN